MGSKWSSYRASRSNSQRADDLRNIELQCSPKQVYDRPICEEPVEGTSRYTGNDVPTAKSKSSTSGSSQGLTNTTPHQIEFGARGQVTHQTRGSPYPTKSGPDNFDRQSLMTQMREEEFARRRLESGYQDESVVIEDAPGYAYHATTNMCETNPTWMILGGSLMRVPPLPLGGMPPAPLGGYTIPPMPPFNGQKATRPSYHVRIRYRYWPVTSTTFGV
jgi:hypothetical protein